MSSNENNNELINNTTNINGNANNISLSLNTTNISTSSSTPHKDYRTSVLENYQCDEYLFSSNFDSGNLGRVELVRKCSDIEISENVIHVEFDVWTTPDCYGTPNESPNRTWFFFSIRGGRPYKNVKINVKNLNRQSKLFAQGMQPVLRIGYYGKWERIKNKPTYNVEEENFAMSFIHQAMDRCDIEHFYAFTYPFTYTECQNMLEKFDKKYEKSVKDINLIINRLINTENEEMCSTSGVKTIGICPRKPQQIPNENNNNNNNNNNNFQENTGNGNNSNITKECQMEATESSSSSFDTLKNPEPESSIYETFTRKQLLNEIYYHRETLINSLEGRKVDLLTISSFHGIQNTREDRLVNLFPDPQYQRCHTFKNKKIIFMSSRVHPGETPASFVLNGFLNLILDKKSTIAQILRQLYVFKIVPILNPDGVYRGFYRTDTLGQNLNRMYMNPKLEIHPSIYAVKKLIKFYHFGFDSIDMENFNETSSSSSSRSIDLPMKDASSSSEEKQIIFDNETLPKSSPPITTTTTTTTSSSSENDDNFKLKSNSNKSVHHQIETSDVKIKTFTEKLIPEIKTKISYDHMKSNKKTVTNINNNNNNREKITENKIKKITIHKNLLGSGIHNSNIRHMDTKLKDNTIIHPARMLGKRAIIKRDVKNMNAKNLSGPSSSSSNKITGRRNILSNHNMNNTNLDISIKSLNPDNRGSINDENTNMFLYIDFHGHASKKGVFMYGNHFSNSAEAVECMLLPRLMSLNCHHFHYDACNFSERNMYRREKRDGLSKEGSGRVAIFKMTGLIKSYTLESNYNTGKYVNSLPARIKDNNANHTTKTINLSPPKYTPAIYEEVGRALGPSILDVTNSNVLSRIQNSEFRSIQGLRITLRNEIEKSYSTTSHSRNIAIATTSATPAGGINNSSNSTVVTTAKALTAQQNVKRIKRNARSASSALPQNDTSKENKAIYSVPWDTNISSVVSVSVVNPSSTSMLIKSQSGNQKSNKIQLKHPRNNVSGNGNGNNNRKIPTTNIKIRSNSAPLYGTKDLSSIIGKKKPKALMESSSSCITTKKDLTAFYIPPKKVKVSNKNAIKGIIKPPQPQSPSHQHLHAQSSSVITSVSVALPSTSLSSSNLQQQKVNNNSLNSKNLHQNCDASPSSSNNQNSCQILDVSPLSSFSTTKIECTCNCNKYFCNASSSSSSSLSLLNTDCKCIKQQKSSSIDAQNMIMTSNTIDTFKSLNDLSNDNICTNLPITPQPPQPPPPEPLTEATNNLIDLIDYRAVPSSSSSSSSPSSSTTSKIFMHHAISCPQYQSHAAIITNTTMTTIPTTITASFRNNKKIDLISSATSASSHLFTAGNNLTNITVEPTTIDNISISSSSSSSSLPSKKDKCISLRKKTFGSSGGNIKLRKKRIIRHETIIIKRKKNKIKSTIH